MTAFNLAHELTGRDTKPVLHLVYPQLLSSRHPERSEGPAFAAVQQILRLRFAPPQDDTIYETRCNQTRESPLAPADVQGLLSKD